MTAWLRPPESADDATARRWIAGEATRRSRWLALDLVVCDRAGGGVPVGEVGLSSFSADGTAEIGYWLLSQARGRGLAAASVRLLTDWAARTLPRLTLVAKVDRSNVSSERVLVAAGYRRLDPADPPLADSHDPGLQRHGRWVGPSAD